MVTLRDQQRVGLSHSHSFQWPSLRVSSQIHTPLSTRNLNINPMCPPLVLLLDLCVCLCVLTYRVTRVNGAPEREGSGPPFSVSSRTLFCVTHFLFLSSYLHFISMWNDVCRQRKHALLKLGHNSCSKLVAGPCRPDERRETSLPKKRSSVTCNTRGHLQAHLNVVNRKTL